MPYGHWNYASYESLIVDVYVTKASGVTATLPEAPHLCDLTLRSLGGLIQ